MADNLPDIYVKLHDMHGECLDEHHPGKDGWVAIKKFAFGFGVKSDGGGEEEDDDNRPMSGLRRGQTMTVEEYDRQRRKQTRNRRRRKRGSGDDDGPFDRELVELEKSFDLSSNKMWKEKCHSGKPIDQIELQACRYGGEKGAEKIPFLRLLFENCTVKSVSVSLGTDEPPTETIHFHYD